MGKWRTWVDSFVHTVASSPNARMQGLRLDAGETALLTQQLEHMITELFNTEYESLKTRQYFPVDNSAPPGAETVSYRQYDKAGRAKIIANYGDDIPLVNVQGRKFTTPVVGLASGYEISIQDLRAAAMAGVALDSMLADTARRAIEQSIDELASTGDADAGIVGFLNHASIPIVTPLVGDWSDETPDEIYGDILELWKSIPVATKQNHYPNTLLLDTTSYYYLSRRMTDGSDKTIKQFVMENLEGLQTIDQWSALDAAGAAGVSRIMAYEKSPRTGSIIIPQEFEQFAPQEKNLAFQVPVHARCGGAKIPYPLAFAYMDNTSA